jgi:glycosyltransferase involved in cell wall biosynthesis
LAKLVKRSFLKEYPVKVINNGIDLSVFKPVHSNFRERHNLTNKFIILGVANKWEKRKGFEYFIELSKLIEPDEATLLVGLSKNQIKQLPKNIIGITRTNNVKELAEIYTVVDVFFNPSLEENFPTVNLESLACGTPVITFNTGGSIETIDDTTGFIVKKGDIKNTIRIIRKIKSEGKEKYSESCIKRANKYYDKDDKFQEYIELYESLGEEIAL